MRKTVQERFWGKVNKHGPRCRNLGPCWLWNGTHSVGGYSYFWNGWRGVGAHVFAFELFFGRIPHRMVVDHVCHNPGCVNPAHLRAATVADNNRNATRRSDNHSGNKGVSWSTHAGKWVAQCCQSSGKAYIGCYSSKESAVAAHRRVAMREHGEFYNDGGAR